MSGERYPERESHFAHKLVRLMVRSCAAQELGCDGVWLVTVIAHCEDAKRYSGAVTYWNDQLLPLLGFRSWGQLQRARERAVKAGWLHYEPGGKSRVGKYWTLIPEALVDLPDGDVSDDHHVLFAKNGERNVIETGDKREANEREAGDKRGRSGDLSSLSLNPIPTPSPDKNGEPDSPKAGKVRKASFDPLTVTFPNALDTEPVRAAWQEWCDSRRERGKPITERAAKMQLKKLSAYAPEIVIQALETAVAGDYTGVFPESINAKGSANGNAAAQRTPSHRNGQYRPAAAGGRDF